MEVGRFNVTQSWILGIQYSIIWGFPGGSVVKHPPANAGDVVWSPGQEDPLQKEMAIHSSILAWEIWKIEEPHGLQGHGVASYQMGIDFLCLSPLFLGICKTSSDNYFAFLHFFFLRMVLITTSCTVLWISIHSSSSTLSVTSNPLNFLSLPLYNHKGFDVGHTWMA